MIDREEWAPIIDYEGRYQVSNCGRIRSIERVDIKNQRVPARILRQDESNVGYMRVVLCNDGQVRRFSVHRLVANAFVRKGEGATQVNHLNGMRADNRSVNLEWCTDSHNKLHAYYVLKTGRGINGQARPVVGTNTDGEVRFRSLMEAQRAGFHASAISQCCKGRWRTHAGFKWRYEVAS